uniref:Uncharacterized protein n=1 Tax=Salix viminalis TaxID=40686 RepID=A0A6N2KMJ4_SALVM
MLSKSKKGTSMPFLSSSFNSSASMKFLTRFSVPYIRAAFLSVSIICDSKSCPIIRKRAVSIGNPNNYSWIRLVIPNS